MPHFKSINFNQNWPKIKLFLKYIYQTYFSSADGSALKTPMVSGGWETELPDPRNSPFPAADFWLRA